MNVFILTIRFCCLQFSGFQDGDKKSADSTGLHRSCCKYTQFGLTINVRFHGIKVWLSEHKRQTLIGFFPFFLFSLKKLLRCHLYLLNPRRPIKTNTHGISTGNPPMCSISLCACVSAATVHLCCQSGVCTLCRCAKCGKWVHRWRDLEASPELHLKAQAAEKRDGTHAWRYANTP